MSASRPSVLAELLLVHIAEVRNKELHSAYMAVVHVDHPPVPARKECQKRACVSRLRERCVTYVGRVFLRFPATFLRYIPVAKRPAQMLSRSDQLAQGRIFCLQRRQKHSSSGYCVGLSVRERESALWTRSSCRPRPAKKNDFFQQVQPRSALELALGPIYRERNAL